MIKNKTLILTLSLLLSVPVFAAYTAEEAKRVADKSNSEEAIQQVPELMQRIEAQIAEEAKNGSYSITFFTNGYGTTTISGVIEILISEGYKVDIGPLRNTIDISW